MTVKHESKFMSAVRFAIGITVTLTLVHIILLGMIRIYDAKFEEDVKNEMVKTTQTK